MSAPPASAAANDAALISRLVKPDRGGFSPETAHEILAIQFDTEDQKRLQQLSRKAQDGTLTAAEQDEMASYRRVGLMLGVLWSRARHSLKQAGVTASNGHEP